MSEADADQEAPLLRLWGVGRVGSRAGSLFGGGRGLVGSAQGSSRLDPRGFGRRRRFFDFADPRHGLVGFFAPRSTLTLVVPIDNEASPNATDSIGSFC